MSMKNYWNLFYLLALVIITSCSGGDDPINNGNNGNNSGGGGDNGGSTTTWTALSASPDTWDNNKRADITYQILVYSFADSNNDGIGDFKGIQDKLDYINSLGVDAIWLSPIHPADSYHGYDVTDYTTVNKAYGSESDFKNLVDAAHAKGIKVYLDFVLNHTGTGHSWFQDAKNNESSKYRDYYFFNETGGNGWYEASSSSSLNKGKLKFVLDWSKKTVTVTEVSSADNKEGDGGIYLYFGDGECKEFNKTGDTTYEIIVDYNSNWGFLIRTSNTTWDDGTKYGAPSTSSQISLGKAFTLDNKTAADIKFAGSKTWYYYGAFGSWMPDLNYGKSSEVSNNATFKAVVKAGNDWIKNFGIDGFRLDAVKHIYDGKDDNVNFLKAWYSEMNKTYKSLGNSDDIYMVGECLAEHNEVAPYYAGLPAMFEFSFWYRLMWALSNKTGMYFAKDILSYQSEYSTHNSNYIEATKLSNHDEDRTAYVLSGNLNWCKQAGAVLLTAQGHPYIYYGEELAMNPKTTKEGNGDEYNRGPLPWGDSYTTQPNKVFNKSVNANTDNVTTQVSNSSSILNVYRTFTKLRNTYPALATGKMTKHGTYNEANSSFPTIAAWYMTEGSQKILVVHNLGSSTVEVPITDNINKVIGILNSVEQNGNKYRMSANSSIVFLLN